MKICPVCQAVAFDDAVICYGCMHRFEEGEGEVSLEMPVAVLASDETERVLPVFSIRFTPEIEKAGSVKWSCVVETA